MAHSILIILTVAALEGLLSADNALVLAVMVRPLPVNLRQKALLYGIGGAFVLRFLALLSAATLIKYWYLQLIGALYLMHLAVSHFARQTRGGHKFRSVSGFWRTVLMVEVMDLAFAIDSILAAVALSSKLWIIYTGGILGLIFMRFAAGMFIRLIEKFPDLEHSAYMVIGWIAVKLFLESLSNWQTTIGGTWHYHLQPLLFWSVTLVLFAVGFIRRKKKG